MVYAAVTRAGDLRTPTAYLGYSEPFGKGEPVKPTATLYQVIEYLAITGGL